MTRRAHDMYKTITLSCRSEGELRKELAKLSQEEMIDIIIRLRESLQNAYKAIDRAAYMYRFDPRLI